MRHRSARRERIAVCVGLRPTPTWHARRLSKCDSQRRLKGTWNRHAPENIMTKHRLSLVFAAAALVAAFAASAEARSTISCESREYRYNRCETYTDGYARLISQQSQAPCIR